MAYDGFNLESYLRGVGQSHLLLGWEGLSEEEKGLLAELERALENGLDPAPILEKLRGGEVDGKQ